MFITLSTEQGFDLRGSVWNQSHRACEDVWCRKVHGVTKTYQTVFFACVYKARRLQDDRAKGMPQCCLEHLNRHL